MICVIRPLADPRAKSEIIVLDSASPEFLKQLAAERQVQDARHLTSNSTTRQAPVPVRPSGLRTTGMSPSSERQIQHRTR